MKKISEYITKHGVFIVILSLFLLIPAAIGFIKTKVNYDILVYLPEDIETIKGEDILTHEFKLGAFSFVMVDSMSTNDLLKLERKVEKISGVNQVLSLADVTGDVIPISMLPDGVVDKLYKKDSTVFVVTFKGSTSEQQTLDAVNDLRKEVSDASRVSGMSALVLDTMELSNKEVVAYVGVAIFLCAMILFFTTDSYLIPIFLLGNIGVAILYNLGSNILLGEISYITKAITAVLQLGVTTDFSIFLYHKYEQAKEKYQDGKKAMAFAIEETFKSVIGSSLTTVAGFLALCAMDLSLGKDIGIVMAKGVICGLVCVLSLFPALLLTFDKQIEKTKHKNFFPQFKKLQSFAVKHSRLIIVIFLLLCIPAIYGNNRYDVYYKLDEALPENLPSRIANNRLAKDYNIISPQIILLNKNLKMNEVKKLTNDLKKIEGVDLVLSPTSMASNEAFLSMLPNEALSYFQNEEYQLLLLNSTYEVASHKLNKQIDTINHLVKKYDDKAIIAGEGALTKDLVEIADHDFKVVNYISIAVIFVIMLFVLKSISLPFLLVITIEFAIFVNMAISYYMGVSLPFIAPIVIGTIQLGATIDYAILMSTKYLEERKHNKNKKEAMKRTLMATVPSIIVSALCFFAATFGVAMYSKIDMIGSICELLSRGSVISMLVVILILPSLLLIFDKVIMYTTKDMKEGI